MSQLMNQVKKFRADYYLLDRPEVLIATVRYDDSCGNGHNTFSITGEVYDRYGHSGEPQIKHKDGQTLWLNSCGCVHEIIADHLPQLAKYIKWHLCSSDGPLHYVENTMYLAGDRDCWGLRKGEVKQHKNKDGLPMWELDIDAALRSIFGEGALSHKLASKTKPSPVTLCWKPYGPVGEGKERDLDAARKTAIWPEATDEELTTNLKERLLARLPALMAEFRKDVEELGFTF